jgi:mRNA interferase MazF
MPTGSAPGFRRPVIIIQSNPFNRSRINTVVAVVITSNLRLSKAPGNLFLPAKSTGLPKDSVANASQIITIDKSVLTEKIGKLTIKQMQLFDEGLRLVLSL